MTTLLRKLAAAVLAASLLLGTTTAASAEDVSLTILGVGDTHSHLDAVGPKDENLDGTLGGLVKASAVIASLRASEPNPIFLHAGDLFFGDVYFNATLGTTELQLLGGLGLDAMALGNHEVWVPPVVLAGVWQQAFGGHAPFPLLCANLAPSPANPYLSFVTPSVIKEVGGVRVGIFALVTPFDLISNTNAQLLGASPAPDALIGLAAAEATKLRDQGAQVVILVSHLGIDLDRAIARYSPVHVDAIVGGHDHLSIVETTNGVPIVHAGAYYKEIGKLRLTVGAAGVSLASAELVEVDQKVRRPLPSESVVAATVARAQLFTEWAAFLPILRPDLRGDFFHQPIATAAGKITNAIDFDLPKRDSGTGNLVTDALRWRTGTDVAFTVSGQTPEGIAEGPIVGEDLFRVVGLGFDGASRFGWRLAQLSITGAELTKALETTIDASLRDHDYVLQVSGMEYVYDSRLAAGHRLLSVAIGGAPLDPSRTYTATVNALLWSMLPQMGITAASGGLVDDFEFTALRDYVIAAGSIDSSGTNRVRDLGARGDARH